MDSVHLVVAISETAVDARMAGKRREHLVMASKGIRRRAVDHDHLPTTLRHRLEISDQLENFWGIE